MAFGNTNLVADLLLIVVLLVMKKGVKDVLNVGGLTIPGGVSLFRIDSRCDARYVKSFLKYTIKTLSKINKNPTLHGYFAHALIILVFLKQSKNFELKIISVFTATKSNITGCENSGRDPNNIS